MPLRFKHVREAGLLIYPVVVGKHDCNPVVDGLHVDVSKMPRSAKPCARRPDLAKCNMAKIKRNIESRRKQIEKQNQFNQMVELVKNITYQICRR